MYITAGCSNHPKNTVESTATQLADLYDTLSTPQPGEWLYEQQEFGQSLDEFRDETPIDSNNADATFYILPIDISHEEEFSLIADVATYLTTIFGYEVTVMPSMTAQLFPPHYFRDEQLNSQLLLDEIIRPLLEQDALGLMGITQRDIYPGDGWNFVFGQANTKEKIGITSFARYGDYNTDSTRRLVLNRLIKTTTHEFLHMLGLQHCIQFACVLNGSNSLDESDKKPSIICPECLAKLDIIFP
ncbi:MAG TPA: archaemetzincin, partial [Chitinophagales bacterium]|nr:archaemetzincin [Chitinophagales bacterium]